jgi:hypothetical protein
VAPNTWLAKEPMCFCLLHLLGLRLQLPAYFLLIPCSRYIASSIGFIANNIAQEQAIEQQ